jgi:membrane protein implicated in regulation of membrane protease activity
MLDPALYWLMIAVILFVLELATPGFVLVFFGAGAAVTALVSWLLPETAIALQLGIFIVVSLTAFFFLRKMMHKRFFSSASGKDGDDVDAQLVNPGDKGVVSTAIVPPAEGRVKCAGTFWRAAAGERIAEGEMVAVVRRQGLLLEVEKI